MKDEDAENFVENAIKFGESVTDGQWVEFDNAYSRKMKRLLRLTAALVVFTHTEPKTAAKVMQKIKQEFGPDATLVLDFGTIMLALADASREAGGKPPDELLNHFVRLMEAAEHATLNMVHESVAEVATEKAFGEGLNLRRLFDMTDEDRDAQKVMDLLDEDDPTTP